MSSVRPAREIPAGEADARATVIAERERARGIPALQAALEAFTERTWPFHRQVAELTRQADSIWDEDCWPLTVQMVSRQTRALVLQALKATCDVSTYENGYFFTEQPDLTRADGREVAWEHATDEDGLSEHLMGAVSDEIGPLGEQAELTLDRRTGDWDAWGSW